MKLDQLRTLLAVLDEGTFEAAADALGISAPAVSQRIKALEASVGRVVVRRTLPCTPSEAGVSLVRTARQMVFLEDEARAELGSGASTTLPIAVNADSLATWFRGVLPVVATWPGVTLRLEVEDQEHSAELLRRGDVMAAVTSDAAPVTGCDVRPLGAMAYRAVAAPTLALRHRIGRGYDWAAMPTLRYNVKDDLQRSFLRAQGITAMPPESQVPGSEAFLAGVLAGLGWGMVPLAQLADHVESGRLVELAPDAEHAVPLFWQAWRLRAPALDRLAEAVSDAAARPAR